MNTKNKSQQTPVVFVSGVTLPSRAANTVQTTQMAAALAGLGVPTYLMCWFDREYSAENIFSYYGISPTFSLINPPALGERRGFRSIVMVMDLLRRFGRRWICHTRIPSVAMISAWLGVQTILELHSVPIQPTQRRFLSLLAKAPGLCRVVVISQALRQVIEAEQPSIARHPIVVAHDAVDMARFVIPESREEARRQLGLPETGTIVGYTGRLTPGKGVHTLLESALGASFTTCIVGGNPDDPSDLLYKYRDEYHSPEIIFVGHQPPAKIPLYLRAFDIVVAPFTQEPVSRFTVNGKVLPYDISGVMSPLKIFEYMASGTPMIVSDLPVLREVLVPGETAIMVPPADPQALGQALDQLIQDTSRANGLSERARAAAYNYTWEARARNIFAGLYSS